MKTMYTHMNLYRQKYRSHNNVTTGSMYWYAFTDDFKYLILEKKPCVSKRGI